ncbi:Coiled-coil domain-containing protein lobo like protein [Dufourea novaeangliae]|uniref:Coiled-coil domain-containing protein lobo like protein n=1 Tax=Dufourea novaeangliae TaxID=178035 RepID=A0A154P308_DUFNO|nr:Coiled-coil domain-containing protein lobo like protein [Dufourea novaeangliae]
MQKFHKGNCFECATFLTSLLLGQGYNAFVVSGCASREQTTCDLTRIAYPYKRQPEPPPRSPVEIEISKYKLESPAEYKSQFLAELEEEEQRKLQEKLKRQEEEQQRLIEELEQSPLDKHWGFRVHAWVAILPELGGLRDQEFSGPLFIEPSTGVSYNSLDTDELYLNVESIWNDQNYWVNMQSSSVSCSNIIWDLTKLELWEHVLPGEPWTMRGIGEAIDEDSAILQEKHLDMPISYVQEIQITDEEYERRYPNGMKTIFYKKTKVDLYTPYLHLDGLIERITKYDDYDYLNLIEYEELYVNRSDQLVKCKKNLTNDSVIDFYERGRPDQCKEHRYFGNGPDTVDMERILEFYHVARIDGLSRLEMHPNYLTQHFVDRDDFLYYSFNRLENRHAEFSQERNIPSSNDIHYREISKILEEFNRNETVKASKDVAIREFAIGENEIRLTYHYEPGQYSRATRMYIKPPLAERGDRLVLNPTMTQGYNPSNVPDKTVELLYELEMQLKQEDRSISYVRGTEVEVSNFLKIRDDEYLSPKLLVSVFNKTRDEETVTEIMHDWSRVQSKKSMMDTVDYLKPYLARLGNPDELSMQQAFILRNQCLNDYKQLLIDRANKILHKFDEDSQKVTKMQEKLLFQANELTREEEEQILEQMNEINFNMMTLETRLNRHKNLVPARYKMLVNHLEQNSHLATFRSTFPSFI